MQNKMSKKDMFGYTVGSIGDSASYNFVINFFSFFMTTIAGVSPIVAGAIISIAIIWDAITDPIVGFVIDNSKSPKGKRRPYILGSLIPLAASMVLMFIDVNMSQGVTNAYYLIILLVFWTSYTVFNIPFYSLGAVITDKDEERVKIAAYREVMGYIGIFVASSVPTYLVGKMVERGIADQNAWLIVAVVVATITVLSIALMWKMTKGKESTEVVGHKEKAGVKAFLKELWRLTKMKPYVLVIICALLTNVYLTLFNSNLIYYAIYNMGVSEVDASVMFTVMTIASIALIPFITKGVNLFGKEKVFVGTMVFSGLSMVFAKFISINSIAVGCVYVVLVGVGTCAYWLCIFNFLYDTIDYTEFKTGERKDGIMMSYYSFLLKLGGAVAAWIQGILLQTSGFNAEAVTQSDATLGTIESLFTVYPGIVMIFAGAVMLLTPLKTKKMEPLRVALAKRTAGEAYTTEGFEDIL